MLAAFFPNSKNSRYPIRQNRFQFQPKYNETSFFQNFHIFFILLKKIIPSARFSSAIFMQASTLSLFNGLPTKSSKYPCFPRTLPTPAIIFINAFPDIFTLKVTPIFSLLPNFDNLSQYPNFFGGNNHFSFSFVAYSHIAFAGKYKRNASLAFTRRLCNIRHSGLFRIVRNVLSKQSYIETHIIAKITNTVYHTFKRLSTKNITTLYKRYKTNPL